MDDPLLLELKAILLRIKEGSKTSNFPIDSVRSQLHESLRSLPVSKHIWSETRVPKIVEWNGPIDR